MTNDDKFKKVRRVRRLFKRFNKYYYKPIKFVVSFDDKRNSYEYISRGNEFNNLSPKEYLDMTRPYLRDMINDHKTSMKVKAHSGNETKFGE